MLVEKTYIYNIYIYTNNCKFNIVNAILQYSNPNYYNPNYYNP